MERKDLKALELSDDQIDKAMALFNKDLEPLKETKTQLETLKGENESLKGQVADRDEKLKDFGDQAGNSQKLKDQIADLQKTIADNDNQATEQLHQVKQDNALSNYLKDAGVRDAKAIMPFLDEDTIKYDDEKGELTGVKEQIENLKTDHDFLFEPENEDPKPGIHATPKGNPNGTPAAGEDAFAKALGLHNMSKEE